MLDNKENNLICSTVSLSKNMLNSHCNGATKGPLDVAKKRVNIYMLYLFPNPPDDCGGVTDNEHPLGLQLLHHADDARPNNMKLYIEDSHLIKS